MRKNILATAAVAATALITLTACGGSNSNTQTSTSKDNTKLPTVSLMVGGIDKQIYLPYMLADRLGYYHKYGVNMHLSTESAGVGAEDAMLSGQVDMAGAWYNHTIVFQSKGQDVVDVVQLSGAPGEREMCAKNSGVHSGKDFAGKTLGVTDIGSGTDALPQFIGTKSGVQPGQFHRVGVGAGATAIGAIQHHQVACVMTTQPTVGALEKQGLAYSAVDLASTSGAQAALGGAWPAASVIAKASWVNANRATVQKVVDALVATMQWINSHSAADIANMLPASYTQNALTSKADYISALAQDKGQFLPDGNMPAKGEQTVQEMELQIGAIKSPVDLSKTWDGSFVAQAHKDLGIK